MKRTRLLFSAIAFCFLFATPVDGHACGCFPSTEAVTGKKESTKNLVLEAKKNANAVFSGKVLSIAVAKNAYWEVRLKVRRTWKGVAADEITVFTPASDSSCGYNFEVGKSYLVYASIVHESELWTNHCTRTGRLAVDVHDDLRVLGKGKAPIKRVSIKG